VGPPRGTEHFTMALVTYRSQMSRCRPWHLDVAPPPLVQCARARCAPHASPAVGRGRPPCGPVSKPWQTNNFGAPFLPWAGWSPLSIVIFINFLRVYLDLIQMNLKSSKIHRISNKFRKNMKSLPIFEFNSVTWNKNKKYYWFHFLIY
jgi:hypothetical protein